MQLQTHLGRRLQQGAQAGGLRHAARSAGTLEQRAHGQGRPALCRGGALGPSCWACCAAGGRRCAPSQQPAASTGSACSGCVAGHAACQQACHAHGARTKPCPGARLGHVQQIADGLYDEVGSRTVKSRGDLVQHEHIAGAHALRAQRDPLLSGPLRAAPELSMHSTPELSMHSAVAIHCCPTFTDILCSPAWASFHKVHPASATLMHCVVPGTAGQQCTACTAASRGLARTSCAGCCHRVQAPSTGVQVADARASARALTADAPDEVIADEGVLAHLRATPRWAQRSAQGAPDGAQLPCRCQGCCQGVSWRPERAPACAAGPQTLTLGACS